MIEFGIVPKGAGAWDSEPEKTELCSRGTLNPRLEQQGEALLLCRGETLGICTAPPRIFGVLSRERRVERKQNEPQPDGGVRFCSRLVQ